MYGDGRDFEELKGKTLTKIERRDNDQLIFTTAEGEEYRMHHYQDCCESVQIEDITGDFDDLIGSPILLAEEVTNNELPEGVPKPEYSDDAELWTFYKLSTNKASSTIRWYGSSNGYYGVGVDFEIIPKDDKR